MVQSKTYSVSNQSGNCTLALAKRGACAVSTKTIAVEDPVQRPSFIHHDECPVWCARRQDAFSCAPASLYELMAPTVYKYKCDAVKPLMTVNNI